MRTVGIILLRLGLATAIAVTALLAGPDSVASGAPARQVSIR